MNKNYLQSGSLLAALILGATLVVNADNGMTNNTGTMPTSADTRPGTPTDNATNTSGTSNSSVSGSGMSSSSGHMHKHHMRKKRMSSSDNSASSVSTSVPTPTNPPSTTSGY